MTHNLLFFQMPLLVASSRMPWTAIWNGANYYIEVFSKSFDKLYKEPSEHLAGDAGAAVQAASEVLASSTHAS